MITTSFPVIQIEKTGKRLRNMRKENGIRVAAVCEYMAAYLSRLFTNGNAERVSLQLITCWHSATCIMYRWKICWYTKRPKWPLIFPPV